MTDAIAEFHNQTRTYAELLAGVAVVTNTGAQQSVLRDFSVTGNLITLKLMAGTAELLRFKGNGAYSGVELVGPSASLTVKTDVVGNLQWLCNYFWDQDRRLMETRQLYPLLLCIQ